MTSGLTCKNTVLVHSSRFIYLLEHCLSIERTPLLEQSLSRVTHLLEHGLSIEMTHLLEPSISKEMTHLLEHGLSTEITHLLEHGLMTETHLLDHSFSILSRTTRHDLGHI